MEGAGARKAFPRYLKILEGKERPRFQITKKEGALGRKIRVVEEILKSCSLCERNCGIDRLAGKTGFCGVGPDLRVFGTHVHMGEEEELIPSATIFMSGCTLRCAYCQNAPDSLDASVGITWSEEKAARWIDTKFSEGCKNVNFVGGEPTPCLYNILKTLELCRANIPVVWNSNAYYSKKTAEILKGVVDIYLLDLRYFNEECAIRLSSAPSYPETARRNLLDAAKDSELLIRVLVMPGHIECDSLPILKWIRENLGEWTRVNILAQYYPAWHARNFPEINRRLTDEEYRRVVKYAREIGLKNLIS